MTLLEQIKTEIGRTIEELSTATNSYAEGRRTALKSILSFIESLEKESDSTSPYTTITKTDIKE